MSILNFSTFLFLVANYFESSNIFKNMYKTCGDFKNTLKSLMIPLQSNYCKTSKKIIKTQGYKEYFEKCLDL